MNRSLYHNPRGAMTSRRTAIGGAAALGAGLLVAHPAHAWMQATPPAGTPAGLGAWAGQLATLDPTTIVEMVLAEPVIPFMLSRELEARETDFTTGAGFPFPNDLVSEVSIGRVSPTDDEFELGTGTMLIMENVKAAAATLATIEPMQSEERSIWVFPFAGLDARWDVSRSGTTSIVIHAGPALVIGTDVSLSDGAYSHPMDGIQNVLQNTSHVLYHLFAATDQALGTG